MNDQEKADHISDKLSGQDLYKCKSVEDINHKPHPFCIGPEHIQKYALDTSKGCAMRVNSSGDWTTGYKSGYTKCGLSVDEHTSDKVAFLQLLRDGTCDEASKILKDLVDQLGENFVEGFVFVDTDEKFRIN